MLMFVSFYLLFYYFITSLSQGCFSSFVSDSTTTLWALTVNTSLLCLFMFQHSAMVTPFFKRALYAARLQVAERSIYVITTSFVLQVSHLFSSLIIFLLYLDAYRY
jgi:hypothetical protein